MTEDVWGSVIAERRAQLLLSQEELALAADVAEKTVYNLEAGRAVRPSTLRKVCDALGLPTNIERAEATVEASSGAPIRHTATPEPVDPQPTDVASFLREVGHEIKRWRKARGLTETQLAARAGLTPDAIRSAEQGAPNEAPDVWKIAEALSIRFSDLTRRAEEAVGMARSGQEVPGQSDAS